MIWEKYNMKLVPQETMWKARYGGYFNALKRKSGEVIINQILNLISNSSKNNLIALTRLFEIIAGSEGSLKHVKRLRWLFQTEHPHLKWWQRVIEELDTNVRNRWIMDIYVSGYYGDNQIKRTEFQKDNGFYPPSAILISVTQKCNFNCNGCWANNYDDEGDLTKDQWREILHEARDVLGIHIVLVVGGEPFVSPYFLELAEEFQDCAFITFTNGSFLNDEVIDKLKKLGNVYPMISLNGYKENTDAVRGEGAYDMVMETLDRLKNAGLLYGTSLTATRTNSEEISSDEFFKLLADKGVYWNWTFHYIPIGENPDASLMTTPEQREKIRIASNHARNIHPMMTIDFWGDGVEMMGCIAGGRQYIHVNAKGDVEPCAFVHLATDNLKNKTLTEALKSPFLTAIRNAIPYDGNPLRPCMIADHPEALRGYYEKYKPYETHRGAADYLTRPDIKEYIDNYSSEVKKIADHNWLNDLYMSFFPLEGEYYNPLTKLCSKNKPENEEKGCNDGDLTSLK